MKANAKTTDELKATVEDCCTRYKVVAHFTVSGFRPATWEREAEGGEVEILRVEILSAELQFGDEWFEVKADWPESLQQYLAECLVEDDSFCDRAREQAGV